VFIFSPESLTRRGNEIREKSEPRASGHIFRPNVARFPHPLVAQNATASDCNAVARHDIRLPASAHAKAPIG
jgi:hypothetical protein